MSAPLPKLDRVIETSLYVDDLERAARFYEDVLGLAVLRADAAVTQRLRAVIRPAGQSQTKIRHGHP